MKGSEKQISYASDILANGIREAVKNANAFIMGSVATALQIRHGIKLAALTREQLAIVCALMVDEQTRTLSAAKLDEAAKAWETERSAGDIIDLGRLDHMAAVAAAVADLAAAKLAA